MESLDLKTDRPQTLVIATNHPRFFLNHRIGLAKKARANGFRVVGMFPDGEETEKIKRMGFDVSLISMSRKGVNPIAEVFTIFSIYRELKKIRPDIYQAFTIKPVIYGAIASRLAGVKKVVCTITGLGYTFIEENWRGRLVRSVVRRLYKFAFSPSGVRVIFRNKEDRQLFLDEGFVEPSQTSVILGTGVDAGKFRPADKTDDGEINILFPSRMLLHKGVVELVEAGERLFRQGLRFKLTLCGDPDVGNPASVSSKQLKEWGKLPFIDLAGYQSNMIEMYHRADIVCLPSYREGLPLSLLEACACGLPIVTTDATGCRDVVIEGENGYLVPIGSVTELAAALQKLIQSKDLREEFGLYARRLAKGKYEESSVVGQYLDIYQREQMQSGAA